MVVAGTAAAGSDPTEANIATATTAPVATAIFKSLICVKSRNALVLSFHSATREVGPQVGALLQEALRGLLGRLPGLRVTVPDSELRFKSGMTLRSLESLPVTW